MKKKNSIVDRNEVLYRYRASVLRVIDGDTIQCSVDLGFTVSVTITFRLARIDAPEIRGKKASSKGHEAKRWLEDQIATVEHIFLLSYKQDKYGRWLADIYLNETDESLNDQMVELGLAKKYR